MSKIEWNKVTPLSQTVAIVLFVAVFFGAFWIGNKYSSSKAADRSGQTIATYWCKDNKSIWAAYQGATSVSLSLSDGRTIDLPLSMSASGARYVNSDESFVFWNKGKTAFVDENGTSTYSDCIERSK